jgi:Nucleotidyl transferase AbiEii toxin, Type IV TA system
MVLAELARLAEREHLLIAAAKGYRLDVSSLPDKLGAIQAATLALQSAGVAHALIGGLAVGIRSGVPRATLDIDFAVTSSSERSALEQILTAAGFQLVGTFPHSINFKHASGEPLQLAIDAAFDPMIARAEPVSLGLITLHVVTKADLLAMKRRAAADPARRRSKALRDQADIALLEGDVPEEGEGW